MNNDKPMTLADALDVAKSNADGAEALAQRYPRHSFANERRNNASMLRTLIATISAQSNVIATQQSALRQQFPIMTDKLVLAVAQTISDVSGGHVHTDPTLEAARAIVTMCCQEGPPTANAPTGAGDFDIVCDGCGEVVPTPHSWADCCAAQKTMIAQLRDGSRSGPGTETVCGLNVCRNCGNECAHSWEDCATELRYARDASST